MQSPAGEDAWGPPEGVFARMIGTWSFERRISNRASMTGSAIFEPTGDGEARYREAGRLRLAGGQEFDAAREYLYHQRETGFAVFFPETPPRLFHTVILVPGGSCTLVGEASHLCGHDHYRTGYEFLPDRSFRIEHAVRGPRKDYVTTTLFRRATVDRGGGDGAEQA
jgi:hypothetical protein